MFLQPEGDAVAHGRGAELDVPELDIPDLGVSDLDVPDRMAALRAQVDRVNQRKAKPRTALPPISFGQPSMDAALPGGGLARAALHEVAGSGPEVEHAAAAALFVAGALAGLDGRVLWMLDRGDLFAPALAAVGLHPDRVIYAEAGSPSGVLLGLEDALRHRGLAGVVGELAGRLTLTASRRLQLAAEAAAVPAFVLRRSARFDDPVLAEPCAAATRWRVGCAPAVAEAVGLGRIRWRIDLIRCRGGEAASWIMEACDAQGRLGLPAKLAHRPAAAAPRPQLPVNRRAAG